MRPIIKVESLGKRYRIGKRESYRTLRKAMVGSVTATARSLVSFLRNGRAASLASDQTHLWALKDVNFEVMPGDVMGIVGRNGAGKSTLLKILARITEPTRGRVELYGRVGSLLEIGTGFHLELTGRDNIFLSGTILGMRWVEIARKFDEIVAFAEIDQFIDTPVKHYSSGMYVRLAFAVAAHLDPEILLVDEVLAVGDRAFQRRCLGKMGDVAREGRTILLVSHNMASIEALCSHCAIIRNGRIEAIGEPSLIVGRYAATELIKDTRTRSLVDHPGRVRSSIPMMTAVTARSGSNESTGVNEDGFVRISAGELFDTVPGSADPCCDK
jgi:lipopolysaccharide transport system ATP-binding protein